MWKRSRKMTPQLKAIIKTRKFVEEEVKEGRKTHRWNSDSCPLCDTFIPSISCRGCPMKRLGNCVCFVYKHGFFSQAFPIEYTLSFLIDLEDCYKRMEE